MASSDATLPDDIEALKARLLAREAALREHEGELTDLRDTVTTLRKTLSDRALEIDHLKLWIAKLQRMQFGRKSEKIDRQIEQLELRLEDLQADDGAATVDAPTGPAQKPASRRDASPFRNICRAKTLFISPTTRAVRNAAARLATSARTFPSNSTMYRGIGG